MQPGLQSGSNMPAKAMGASTGPVQAAYMPSSQPVYGAGPMMSPLAVPGTLPMATTTPLATTSFMPTAGVGAPPTAAVQYVDQFGNPVAAPPTSAVQYVDQFGNPVAAPPTSAVQYVDQFGNPVSNPNLVVGSAAPVSGGVPTGKYNDKCKY